VRGPSRSLGLGPAGLGEVLHRDGGQQQPLHRFGLGWGCGLKDQKDTHLFAFPLTCPQCGTEMRIVAFVTEVAPVQRILNHIGEPAAPPRIAPTRGPPQWEEATPEPSFSMKNGLQAIRSLSRRKRGQAQFLLDYPYASVSAHAHRGCTAAYCPAWPQTRVSVYCSQLAKLICPHNSAASGIGDVKEKPAAHWPVSDVLVLFRKGTARLVSICAPLRAGH